MRTAGYSAEGSAWASEPPMVPRVRIGRWPTHRVASRRSGSFRATTGENSIVRWRVIAPSLTWPSCSLTYASDAMRFRSTSAAGRLSRKFKSGMRLWPPARTLASPP